jgi:HK97 gp10 family phage protein
MIKMTIVRKSGQNPFKPEKIASALDAAGREVENEAKSLCPVNTGETRASINRRTEGNTEIVGTNKANAPYIEFGTGPHKTSTGSDEFVASIIEWTARVLGEDESVAWAIINHIRKYGTKPHSFMRAGLDNSKEKAVDAFKKTLFGGA